MSKYVIRGGERVCGDIKIKGAKNSVLTLLAACVLADGVIVLHDCPHITDVDTMLEILKKLGCKIVRNGDDVTVDSRDVSCGKIPCELASELRSSVFILGPLLSRLKKAKVAYPGGCDIGLRPIDIHLAGLRELGVKITEKHGYINCDSSFAKSNDIILDLPSVGATENLVMTCVFLDGVSIIRNCAKEPEIVDLQNFLNAMGANVSGAGTGVIKVEGVKKLHGTEYTPIPDRIVAGTYLIGAAMCGGELTLTNVNPEHLSSLLAKLPKSSCKITCARDKINMICNGRCESIPKVETTYYPGFPTDLQTQILTLQTVSEGTSVIVENIFETRFKTVPQLLKMGADVTVNGRTAVVRGVERLTGAEVSATDLRGGASLVLAGMCAQGETVVDNIGHIDRGYEDLSMILPEVGVKIKRV